MKTFRAAAVALALAALASSTLLATDGYFAHGYGMKAKSMGGASTAIVWDTMGGAVNPAQMVVFGSGFDLGADLFSPRRDSSRSANVYGLNGTVDSDSRYFPMPELGFNRMLNDRVSLGITVYGNGGMNTDYAGGQLPANRCGAGAPVSNLLCGPGRLGVNLSQMIIAPTVAFKLGKHQAFGISPLIGYQWFKAEGLQAFTLMSSSGTKLTDVGTDRSYGAGVRVGYLAQISDQFSIGASYSPRMKMTKFDKYAGLFAEQGSFDLPQNFNVGVALRPTPGTLVAVDYQRIEYSAIKAIGNTSMSQSALGTDAGPGFGWKDVNVLKAGVSMDVTKALSLRAGFNYCNNPIQSKDVTFNILAPGVVQKHLTAGLGFKTGANAEVNVTYMHAFQNSVTGSAMMMPGGGQEQIRMYENSFGISISKRLGRK